MSLHTDAVLVLGLGLSGAAAAEALLDAGVDRLRVVDTRDHHQVGERAAQLAERGVDVRIATDDPAVLDGVELVVASPGVAPTNPVLAAAIESTRPVWSEPELAWRLNSGQTRLLAVTGTNGKTSTTELLASCLHAPVGGNIGTPLSALLTAPNPPALVVAELSSFQLRFTEQLRTCVGVLLNVAADHLDWHASVADYAAAKARVWAGQRCRGSAALHERDWAVVGVDDPGVRSTLAAHPPPAGLAEATMQRPEPGQVGVADGVLVSRIDADADIVAVDELKARGAHNVANAAAAVAAAVCAGADPATLAAALTAYTPGAHRLELVATEAGVRYVNDSKATNPHAAAAALSSFPDASVVWIAGGLNKGLDFDDLADRARTHVRAAVTVGTSGPELAALTRRLGIPTVEAGTLARAVPAAADLARAGDTVLLAPACASMDQFADYRERGQAFRDAVAALGAPSGEESDHGR